MNHSEKLFDIQGIYLGGFQVFDEITFVPLRRLTLLFGPNSAGKSAVDDALNLIQQEFFHGKYSYKRVSRDSSELARYWRRRSEDWDSYVPELTLGVQFTVFPHLIELLEHGELNRPQSKHAKLATERFDKPYGGPAKIDFIAKYRYAGDDSDEDDDFKYRHPSDRFLKRDFTFSINGESIAESKHKEYVQLNFAHPVFLAYQPAVDFSKIANKYPEIFQVENGVVRVCHIHSEELFDIPGNKSTQGTSAITVAVLSIARDSVSGYNLLKFNLSQGFGSAIPDDLDAALDEFSHFFSNLYKLTVSDSFFKVLPKVPASRTIPSKEDLCFLKVKDIESEELCDSFCLKNGGNPTYLQLAWNANVRDKVNRMFTDHLFSERGYCVGDEQLVITSKQSKDEAAILLRLHLLDAQGRKFLFDEVGSGIGYVLPVLCSVCYEDKSHETTLALIHQPELHLHPALQATLGDVFIECSLKEKQFVIETHSEHLLLRILKRIRQTGTDRPPTPELQIKPEDVAILYFDPSPTGVTKVRHIRVSEDGEFLDRWPRGFFGERDQELFDE